MLRISGISAPVSVKNNGNYRVISFRHYDELANGELVPTNLSKNRNVFSKNDISKGDELYNMIQEGSITNGSFFAGNVIKFETTPYQIDDNLVNSTTVVVFSNEDPFDVADKSLRNNYASVISNGVARSPKQLEKPVTV